MKKFFLVCILSCLFFNSALGSVSSLSFSKIKQVQPLIGKQVNDIGGSGQVQQIFVSEQNKDLCEAIDNDDIEKAEKIIKQWKNLDPKAVVDLNIDLYLQKACLKLQITVIKAILEKSVAKTGKILTLDMIKALGISQCIENILFTDGFLAESLIESLLKKYSKKYKEYTDEKSDKLMSCQIKNRLRSDFEKEFNDYKIKIIGEIFNYIIKEGKALPLEIMQALELNKVLMKCANESAFRYAHFICGLFVTKENGFLSLDAIQGLGLKELLMQCINDCTLEHIYPMLKLCVEKTNGALSLDTIQTAGPYVALRLKDALAQCIENHPEYIYPICKLFAAEEGGFLSLETMQVLKLDQVLMQCAQKHPEHTVSVCKLCVTKKSGFLSLKTMEFLKLDQVLILLVQSFPVCAPSICELCITRESVGSSLEIIKALKLSQLLRQCAKSSPMCAFSICELCVTKKIGFLSLEIIQALELDKLLVQYVDSYALGYIYPICKLCIARESEFLSLEIIQVLNIEQVLLSIYGTMLHFGCDRPIVGDILKICNIEFNQYDAVLGDFVAIFKQQIGLRKT